MIEEKSENKTWTYQPHQKSLTDVINIPNDKELIIKSLSNYIDEINKLKK